MYYLWQSLEHHGHDGSVSVLLVGGGFHPHPLGLGATNGLNGSSLGGTELPVVRLHGVVAGRLLHLHERVRRNLPPAAGHGQPGSRAARAVLGGRAAAAARVVEV